MMQFEEQSSPISSSINTNTLLSKTFFRMFLGLLATMLAAGYTFYSGMFVGNSLFTILIAEFIIAIVFGWAFKKLPAAVVTCLFYIYSILTGVTLSTLFAVFELNSIMYALIGTAALFGILAYIGKNTSLDLSRFSTTLTICLILGLILTVINLFVGNSTLDIILSWAILFIFSGCVVCDVNRIIALQNLGIAEDEKLYIYGAMELYLDFINMFIRILYIMGGRRRD